LQRYDRMLTVANFAARELPQPRHMATLGSLGQQDPSCLIADHSGNHGSQGYAGGVTGGFMRAHLDDYAIDPAHIVSITVCLPAPSRIRFRTDLRSNRDRVSGYNSDRVHIIRSIGDDHGPAP
jgi:hypothetical protein